MKNINIKKDEWIDAIPDKLICPCSICGCRVDFDYVVDDDFWAFIVPQEYRLDVLCLRCLDIIAKRKGENVCDYIERIYYCGEGKTMELLRNNLYLFNRN